MSWSFFKRLILNQPHKRPIQINQRPNPPTPRLNSGRMQSRLPSLCLRQTSIFTNRVEAIQIVQPQATPKRTRQRIEIRIRKELQRQIAALQNHPAPVTPPFRKTKSRIKLRSLLKIPRRQIRRSNIAHSISPVPRLARDHNYRKNRRSARQPSISSGSD